MGGSGGIQLFFIPMAPGRVKNNFWYRDVVVIWFGLASGGRFSLFEAKMLTFDIFELQKSFLHVNWSEFRQEFNGDGPTHVTRVRRVSDTCFFHFSTVFLNF